MFWTGLRGTNAGRDVGPDRAETSEPKTTPLQHLRRVGLLMAAAAGLLAWLGARTDVLFADGLRYIAQAQAFERGSADDAVKHAVDHPAYPLLIVAAHRVIGGDGPDAWQAAAQVASAVAGVFLVVPLYLVSRELFGDACAASACLLVFAVPLTGHVFADTLSESTFLLFWTSGLWAALRFFRGGALRWVPAVVGFSALAYWSRPEGLLLPAAVVATLAASPVWVARGLGRRGLVVAAVLVVGLAGLIGPYVALKGGLGTKPSIARLLGTAPRSAAHAVERQRPLEPGQSAAKTYTLAAKAVGRSVADAVTWPLLALAVVGLLGLRPRGAAVRQWRLLAVIGAASALALVRLYVTGGYCSPRHALVPALILIPAAASGVQRLIDAATRRPRVRSACWASAFAAVVTWNSPESFARVNEGLDGYKQAGRWLSAHADGGSRVVDLTGWSQFYGGRPGYTFADLVAAPGDPAARWVVAREAHLKGPWDYCERLRALVNGLEPVEVFVGSARRRPTRVYLFDRQVMLSRTLAEPVRR